MLTKAFGELHNLKQEIAVKTKSGNKLNMLLMAITLLLVFVSGIKIMDTHSWLINRDEIGFVVSVADINLVVKQGERIIENNGNIYLGTEIIEADKPYTLNVTLTNVEEENGFYIRCQAFAVIGGKTYNINSFIDNDLYKANDGWAYLTQDASNSTHRTMAGNEVLTIIDTVTFPSALVDSMQGKNVKLFLYIEGNPTDSFN